MATATIRFRHITSNTQRGYAMHHRTHAQSFATTLMATAVASLLTTTAAAQASGGQSGGQSGARSGAPHGSAVQANASPADSAAVARTVGLYHDALERGDSTRALALLAPDAVVLESGSMESLTEYRAHHLPSDIEFARAIPEKRSAIGVSVRGDVAWATSTTTAQGTFRGRAVNSAGAELMVLTRTPDGWRIAAIHWSSRRRS